MINWLMDDAFSARVAFLTHGQVTSQGLEPHDDLLAQFPFLGVPDRSDGLGAGSIA